MIIRVCAGDAETRRQTFLAPPKRPIRPLAFDVGTFLNLIVYRTLDYAAPALPPPTGCYLTCRFTSVWCLGIAHPGIRMTRSSAAELHAGVGAATEQRLDSLEI